MKYSSRYLTQLKNIYYNLTGGFSVKSDRGNNYIMVAYHCDANNFLTAPLRTRTGLFVMNGLTKLHENFIKQGLTPKLHIMNNEV